MLTMSRTREIEDDSVQAQSSQNVTAAVVVAAVAAAGQPPHTSETPILDEVVASSAVAPEFTSRDFAEIISGNSNRGTIFTGRDLADMMGGNIQRESSLSSAVFKSVDSFVSKFNSRDSFGKVTAHCQSIDEQKVQSRRSRLDSIDTNASAEMEDVVKPQSPVQPNSTGFPGLNSVDTISVVPFPIGRETAASPTTMAMTMDALDVLTGKMKRPNPSGFNAMFASSDWQGNFRGEHVDVEYQGMFSSVERQHAEALKMLSDDQTRIRATSTAEKQDISRTDWMKDFNNIFIQPSNLPHQSLQKVLEAGQPTAVGAPIHSDPPPVVDIPASSAATTQPLVVGDAPTFGAMPTAETQPVVKTDWMKEFNSIFTQVPPPPPPQALPAAHPPVPAFIGTEGVESANNSTCTPATVQETKKKKVKKRRSQEPEVKEYVDNPTSDDVLLGRGGRSNHHSGNKRYRDEIIALQTPYRDAGKDGKTEISQLLVDRVRSYGGRFLKLDESVHRWYLVKNIVARRKASQALRETNTPEVRQAKRERLSKKKSGSEQESISMEST